MYKVSMHDLIAIKQSLIESNRILSDLYANPMYKSVSIASAIEANEKQIKVITENYKINDN
jgi:hypothetical protein